MASNPDPVFRQAHVGASEVSALFGASPFVTEYELHHRKRGLIDAPDLDGNDRVEAGLRLEGAIIEWACEKWSYRVIETPDRMDNGRGLGGHPDRIVMCPTRGRGVIEVKTADWLVAKKWGDEPPLHYQLQAQAYAGLTDADWCDLIILVGGNDLRRFQMTFRPVVYADMEARVAEFWTAVRNGTPPKPDYTRDGAAIAALNVDAEDTIIDLRADNRAAWLAAEITCANATAKEATGRADAAKAELLEKMGANATAFIEGWTVRATTVAATPERVAEPGEIIKGRKAYRRFNVKPKGE